jgi:hypothetical protein
MFLSNEALDQLQRLSEASDAPPWRSMIEGRDHLSGDSFIMAGVGATRGEDIYVTRDSGPAPEEYLDLISAAVTNLPLLIEEVRTLRQP